MSLLLEVVPEWLISRALAVLDSEGNFSALGERGSDNLAAALRLLFNVIQLSKKEVTELEDYVDASMDHVVDLIITLVVLLSSLLVCLSRPTFFPRSLLFVNCFQTSLYPIKATLIHWLQCKPLASS